MYCDEKSQFPMRITGIFQDSNDGTVYLDFEGNESDIFESEVEDIAPIPITLEILKKSGFNLSMFCLHYPTYTCEKTIGEIAVKLTCNFPNFEGSYWEFAISKKGNTLSGDIMYIHELQNLIRFFEIEWEVRL